MMPPMIGKIYHVTALLLFAAAFVSPSLSRENPGHPEWTRFEFTQVHMGTEFKIILYAPDADAAAQASNAAFDRIATLDTIMSDYNPGSELMQLCQRAGGPPEHISDDLFRVLSQAQELSQRSSGAFDITVGPVVRLWRVARARGQLPDPDRLAQALKLVGYKNLRLDLRNGTAELLKSGMLLDLGGIAKGYAADEAIAVLKAQGIQRALVAGAGDIAASASPPGKHGWVIEIAPLDSQDKTAARFFLLHDGAVSTSGDSEQHLDVARVRYSHIINPKTGYGLTGRSSVTVVAAKGITADSLATAVSVLGPERGLELIKTYPDAGVFCVVKTGQGLRKYELRLPLMTLANPRHN
jgi:FAD:protein FMN transferase